MAYGNYYPVSPLQDKFGTSGIQSGTSRHGSLIPTEVTDSDAAGYWSIDTDIVINRTQRVVWTDVEIEANSASVDFEVATTNGRHVTLVNSIVNSTNPQTFSGANLFVPAAGAAVAGDTENGGYSFNLINNIVNVTAPDNAADSNAAVIADDVIDCAINMGNYSNGTDNGIDWNAKPGATLRGTTFKAPVAYNTTSPLSVRTAGVGFYTVFLRGVPTEIRDVTFQNVLLNKGAVEGSLQLVEPNFSVAAANYFYNINPIASDGSGVVDSDAGIITVGPYIWAETDSDMPRSSAFPSKILWGGSATPAARGHIIQNYAWNPTVQTPTGDAASGVYYYLRTNVPAAVDTDAGEGNMYQRLTWTGTGTNASIPSLAESQQLITRYIVGADGKLRSDHWRRASDTSWTAGYINWTKLEVETGQGDTEFTTNYHGQSAGDGVICSPVQVALKDNTSVGGATSDMVGMTDLFSSLDVRGYAYEGGNDVTNYTQTTLGTGLHTIDTSPKILTRSPWVRPSNIVSSNLASGVNIFNRFPTTNTAQVSYNDLHDMWRYLWSDYQLEDGPTVSAGTATLHTIQTGVNAVSPQVTGAGANQRMIVNTDTDQPIVRRDDEAVHSLVIAGDWHMGRQPIQGGIVTASVFHNPKWTTALPSATAYRDAAAFQDMSLGGTISVNVSGADDIYLTAVNIQREGATLVVQKAAGSGSGRIILVGDWPTSVTYPVDSDNAPVTRAPAEIISIINDIDTEIHFGVGTAANDTDDPTWVQGQTLAANASFSYTIADIASNTRVAFRMAAVGYGENAIQNTDIIAQAGSVQTIRASQWLTKLAYDDLYPLTDAANSTIQTLNFSYLQSGLAGAVNGANQALPAGSVFENTGTKTRLYIGSSTTAQAGNTPSGVTSADEGQTLRLLMQSKDQNYVRLLVDNRTINAIGGFDRNTPYIDPRFVIFVASQTGTPYVTGIVNTSGALFSETAISAVLTLGANVSLVRNLVGAGGLSPQVFQTIVNAISAELDETDALIRRENRATRAKIDPLY